MKICLAGTGAMGVIHAKALPKIDGVEIVSIASRTEESGKAFAAEYKIPFTSTSFEACIDQPGVDAVILTTPSDQHHDQTILALEKGKHVQVEIPMSLNLQDAEHMLATARWAGKVCMVTHTRRFSTSTTSWSRRTSSAGPTSTCTARRAPGWTTCCGTTAAIRWTSRSG